MRDCCEGCVHRRAWHSGAGAEMICHYILDTGISREWLPEECKELGSYTSKDSKEGRKVMLTKAQESWDSATSHMGRKNRMSIKQLERFRYGY